ncbi:MAG: MoaD/ThiS family protein [Planctomycetes bacterium]|nr:MoaD/ThiS family protein [Planctomycetota bacterium]
MKIKIGGYGILRSYIGQTESAKETEIPAAKSIKEIIADLAIPEGMVMLVSVNDQQQSFDYIVKEGDDIKLIPPVSGG